MRRLLALGRRGAATVELAVALPLTAVLLGNLIDYGVMLRRHAQLAAGVANAADYAARSGASVSSATLTAVTISSSGLAGATANATAAICHCPSGTPRMLGAAVTCTTTCADGGVAQRYVTIIGSYTYTPSFPLVVTGGARTLNHSATVVVR
jgi:Flp pilus assembly protein TadG